MDIRSLAVHLGLSIGTVSRALNNRADVNAETRNRVRAAAAALGYAPNHSGQSLRRGVTDTVAFVLANRHDAVEHGDPFFMGLFEGIQSALARHGLDLMILLSRAGEDTEAFLGRAVGRGVADGWLISGTQRHDNRIDALIRRNLPFATLGRSLSGGSQPWLDLDFEGIADASVDRLAGWGHRRIALVGHAPEANFSALLSDRYRLALARHGLRFDPSLLLHDTADEAGGERAAARLLDAPDPPTALLVNGETMASGIYRRLRAAGLEPGRDVSVIGTRATPTSRTLTPRLTAFDLSLHDLGEALAAALLAVVPRFATGAPPTQRIWPMQLVAGDSDGPAPGFSRRAKSRIIDPKKRRTP